MLTDLDKIRYDDNRYRGKQVEILYEPVAVRRSNTAGLPKATFREKPLEFIFVTEQRILRRRDGRALSRNIRIAKFPGKKPRAPVIGKIKIKGDKNMQKRCREKALSLILCMTLIVAMAFYTTGCNGKTEEKTQAVSGTEAEVSADKELLGEGETEFDLTVADEDGNETKFEVHTDKETVGEALQELGMIEGEDGEYGLYVKTVNGITVDYENDGKYWAFYINDEYAQTGVDATAITEGDAYSFRIEK